MKYLTITNPSKTWIIDLEADDLEAKTIWCVCVKNFATEEEETFLDKERFNVWLKEIGEESVFVGHNAISYDIPTLNRLWSCGINLVGRVIDTLVLSYLYRPALEGGHSLGQWGRRLNILKGEYNDWSKLTDEMINYCQQDVRLTLELYKALTKRMLSLGYSELSATIEHKIRVLIDEQKENGFWFDRESAALFRDQLRGKQSDISKALQQLFPPRLEEVARYSFRRLKDGSPTASYERHRNKYPKIELLDADGIKVEEWVPLKDVVQYACFDYVPFNLGSPKQRVSRLLELGWEPTNFTPTKTEEYPNGFPKVDEDALVKFAEISGRPEVAALAEWLVLQGRASMLDTWFNNLGDDSRIHGRLITCGASTRRMTHNSPNTANIPSGAKARYGHECRSFWGVEPGNNLALVGYDASGLETAGLCHYLNNPKATEILLRPKPEDIHTANSVRLTEALGRPVDREWGAKTTWYAWLYGAYPPKLGSILKGPPSDGDVVVDTFFRNVPGLKKLIEEVQDEWKSNNGRLKTIDGGHVWCPGINASLNYKIQSAGAIVMKLTSILLNEEIKKESLRAKRVGDIHDEGQLEVHEADAERVGILAVECIQRAGLQLDFKVTLGGDYKIGKNWSETH